jgi:hypothetical protein
MTFPPAQRAAAESLSPAALRLVDRVEAEPELLRRSHHEALFTAARDVIPVLLRASEDAPYALQPWPLLLSASRHAVLEEMALGLARLMRSLPQRAFGGEAAKLQRFYGLPSEMLATLLLTEPTGIDELICRLDVVDTADGPRCVEFNAGNCANWQASSLSPACLEASPLADLLRAEGARWDDTVRVLMRHAVACCAAEPRLAGDELNLAVVAATTDHYRMENHPGDYYRSCYLDALAELAPQRSGRLHLVESGDLAFEDGALVLDGDVIHGVVEQNNELTPQPLFRASKAGRLKLFSPPVGPLVLGDKRNLAVLSTAGDSGLLGAEETSLVRRFVPWSRLVSPAVEAAFRGAPPRPLRELLLAERHELVLKGALSVGGEEVVVGRLVDEARWSSLVDAALAGDGWIVQEYLDAVTYPLQAGEDGWAPHRIVWGPWVFGQQYGGLFVRVLPAAAGPVVNLGTGAGVGLAFVVGDD